jgi:hypothetical protein
MMLPINTWKETTITCSWWETPSLPCPNPQSLVDFQPLGDAGKKQELLLKKTLAWALSLRAGKAAGLHTSSKDALCTLDWRTGALPIADIQGLLPTGKLTAFPGI